MRRMRRVVKHYNIYRWAANLIGAAAEVRLDPRQPAKGRGCSISMPQPLYDHLSDIETQLRAHRRVSLFLDLIAPWLPS